MFYSLKYIYTYAKKILKEVEKVEMENKSYISIT
jgi:hypothetical protein